MKTKLKYIIIPTINFCIFAVLLAVIIKGLTEISATGGWTEVGMYLIAIFSAPFVLGFAVVGVIAFFKSDKYKALNLSASCLNAVFWLLLLILSFVI